MRHQFDSLILYGNRDYYKVFNHLNIGENELLKCTFDDDQERSSILRRKILKMRNTTN